MDADFSNKILITDEAHCHLDDLVNRQNCRIWDSENPRVSVEKRIHRQHVIVWFRIWAGGIIGPSSDHLKMRLSGNNSYAI